MAIIRGPKIVRSGLVLALDAADKSSSIDIVNQALWRDLSGNNYHVQLINGPAFNTANGGNILFDGTNDYAEGYDTQANFNTLEFKDTTFTVSVWFKISVNSPNDPIIIRKKDLNNNGWAMRLYYESSTDIRIYTDVSNLIDIGGGYTSYFSNYRLSAPFSIQLNKWTNVVVVITTNSTNTASNSLNCYINGIESNGTQSITVNYRGSSVSTLRLGSQYFFNANIALAHIYDRGLTIAEIIQNYTVLKPRFGL
jgi:hypothetical protein